MGDASLERTRCLPEHGEPGSVCNYVVADIGCADAMPRVPQPSQQRRAFGRPGRALLLALVVPLLAAAMAAPAAFGFRVGGTAWPGKRIPYFNTDARDRTAVKLAVNAWNHSGAHVRFVAVSRSQAKLLVIASGRHCYGVGEATIGYGSPAWVRIAGHHCNTEATAQLLAHEFGHVLGLNHETRRCATMNPTYYSDNGSVRGGDRCHPKAPLWEWHCGLLEKDDVRGAIHRYGGRVHLGPAFCPIYAAGPAPGIDSVVFDQPVTPATATVTLRRPAPAKIPKFLNQNLAAFAGPRILIGTSCPAAPDVKTSWDFQQTWAGTAVGATHTFTITWPATAGRYCVSAFEMDGMGRASRAATNWVDVPALS